MNCINTFGNKYLFDFSRYALNSWLFTPVPHPVDEAERAYNRWHRKNRCLVENTIGILKQRFRLIFLHKFQRRQ